MFWAFCFIARCRSLSICTLMFILLILVVIKQRWKVYLMAFILFCCDGRWNFTLELLFGNAAFIFITAVLLATIVRATNAQRQHTYRFFRLLSSNCMKTNICFILLCLSIIDTWPFTADSLAPSTIPIHHEEPKWWIACRFD